MPDATAERRPAGRRGDITALNITVLMGGPSSEREVSLQSGRAIAEALTRRGHHVTAADIAPDDPSTLDRRNIDVVFIALHGGFGENGQVQRLCQDRKLPYVGSGPEASALAMDKVASKQRFRQAGLTTPDWIVLDSSTPAAQRSGMLEEVLPPCVAKPIDNGSSVGVTIASDEGIRDRAIADLLGKYRRCMVEKFVIGREMTVGILGDSPLPVIEIRPARDFYDYTAKYDDEATQYLMAQLSPAVEGHLRGAALTAHRTLGCRDMSRVDFILTDDGVANVLEVNTIPGFTSHSLLPKGAAAAGIDFGDLCQRLVLMAMERRER